MDTKTIIKWGLILVVGFILLRWVMNAFANDIPTIAGGSLYSGYYTAPLPGPGYINAWQPPYPPPGKRRNW